MLMVVVSPLTLKKKQYSESILEKHPSTYDIFRMTAEFSHLREHRLTFNTYLILLFSVLKAAGCQPSRSFFTVLSRVAARSRDEESLRQKFRETSARVVLDLWDVAPRVCKCQICLCFSLTQTHTHTHTQAPAALTH